VQPGAVGAIAGSVRLAAGARVPGAVVAGSVHVARRVRVGRLFCQLVSGGVFGPGVVGGPTVTGSSLPACATLQTPVVDAALVAPVPVTPGSGDLVVPPRTASAPTAPGAYGNVRVGRGALLQLAGGTYQMRAIVLAPKARLVCLDDCRIGVAEDVRLGAAAQFGAPQRVGAANVRLDVADGVTGMSFRTGPRAIVAGTVFAPVGTVMLGPDGEYRGAFVGRSVVVRARSRVREASAFAGPPRS
jgi:hypothetical protein